MGPLALEVFATAAEAGARAWPAEGWDAEDDGFLPAASFHAWMDVCARATTDPDAAAAFVKVMEEDQF